MSKLVLDLPSGDPRRGLSPMAQGLIGSEILKISGEIRAAQRAGTVVYPVPSWNNNHYCHLVGARGVALPTSADDGFLPTAKALQPLLAEARLLALCSPLNPAGTVLAQNEVRRIAELVVDENR